MTTNKITAADIEAVKAAGGSLSGIVGPDGVLRTSEDAQVFEPKTSTKISGYGSNIRPRIAGTSHDPNTDGLVAKPDISKYNAEHEERRRADAARRAAVEAEKEELSSVTDPRKLQAQLSAMDRSIRRLQKQIKDLQQ